MKVLNGLGDIRLVRNCIPNQLLTLSLCVNKLSLENVVLCAKVIKNLQVVRRQRRAKGRRYRKSLKNNLRCR